MKKKYDFIVIGAGSGGVRFARLMASNCLLYTSDAADD